jgi:AbrB family looped-hinge helix DNA binding protein
MDSTLTAKGQTTIPKAVRERLGLKPGDKVKYLLHADGTVALLPKLPASALRGVSRYHGPPVSLEQMDEAIAAGAAGEPPPPKRT